MFVLKSFTHLIQIGSYKKKLL